MELTNGLRIYLCILFFVGGTVFGSFLNCMAWRIAHHESVLKGRSHCAVCGHTLGAADLIPIFSYLFLRGRCRYCKEKISPRYMAAEVVCGAGFVLSFLRFGLSVRTLQIVVLFCILLALSLVDFEIYEIPDRFILAGIVWYIATVWTAGRKLNLMGMTVSAVEAGRTLSFADCGWNLLAGLIGGLAIGGGMLGVSLLFDHLLGKESMGGGDIKLFFMTSLYLGLAQGLFSLILSCIIGLIIAGVMRKQKVPFGPAISLAAFLSLLYGESFVNWYLSLIM
jgi:leader peptidase (prepilin peptidase)/N-methyltransferase